MILVRSSDTAGNTQTQFSVGVSSLVVRVDKDVPVSAIALPVDDSGGGGTLGRYKPLSIACGNSQFLLNSKRLVKDELAKNKCWRIDQRAIWFDNF